MVATLDLEVVLPLLLICLAIVCGFFEGEVYFGLDLVLSLLDFRVVDLTLAFEAAGFFLEFDLKLLRGVFFYLINSLSFYFLAANFSFFFAAAIHTVY